MGIVRYTHEARENLLAIWVTIAARDPRAADRVYDRIEQRVAQLGDHPQLGPARPDIAPEARMLVVERWLVLYRVVADGAQIVRVMDGARDMAQLDWPSDGEHA